MKKRTITLLLAGAMAASMALSFTANADDKVKLTFYGWVDEESYLQPLFDAFNEQSEDAYIEAQYVAVDEYEANVISAMAANTQFDVVAINGLAPFSNYQQKGFLMDMTDLAAAADFNPEEVYGALYTGSNVDGMHGFPYRNAVWFMFYNKTMLDDLGIDYQTETSYTWSEFRELCQEVQAKLAEEGKDILSDPNNGCYAGLVGMQKYMTPAQKGIPLSTEDLSAIEEYWTLWHDLEADGTHLPYAEKLEYSTNVGQVYWVPGRIAFFQNATWGIAMYNGRMESGEMEFEYGCMPTPVPDGVADNTNLVSPNYLGIPTTCQHPEQAYEFIQFACTHDGAMILANQAILPGYADEEVSAAYAENCKQKDDALARIISSPNNQLTDICDIDCYAELQSVYEEAMESYLVGNTTLEESLENYKTKRTELIGY